MTAVRTADTPRRALHRIGRLPDPLAWPPLTSVGAGRFDDPRRRFSTLYAAESRLACFVETLARFRPTLQSLVARATPEGAEELVVKPGIPDDWIDRRRLARFRLKPWQRWLDLRAIETREALRGELAEQLLAVGVTDLDIGGVVTPDRALTQVIAGWAYDNGFQRIVYASRLDSTLTCWALFEGAVIAPVSPIRPIRRDDPDLRAVARLFGLTN